MRANTGPCRQTTGEVAQELGECIRCGAASGEQCRQPKPGSSWSDPIWHGKWRIYAASWGPLAYDYAHDNYDGADETDRRHGNVRTVEEAIAEIDQSEGA